MAHPTRRKLSSPSCMSDFKDYLADNRPTEERHTISYRRELSRFVYIPAKHRGGWEG